MCIECNPGGSCPVCNAPEESWECPKCGSEDCCDEECKDMSKKLEEKLLKELPKMQGE